MEETSLRAPHRLRQVGPIVFLSTACFQPAFRLRVRGLQNFFALFGGHHQPQWQGSKSGGLRNASTPRTCVSRQPTPSVVQRMIRLLLGATAQDVFVEKPQSLSNSIETCRSHGSLTGQHGPWGQAWSGQRFAWIISCGPEKMSFLPAAFGTTDSDTSTKFCQKGSAGTCAQGQTVASELSVEARMKFPVVTAGFKFGLRDVEFERIAAGFQA